MRLSPVLCKWALAAPSRGLRLGEPGQLSCDLGERTLKQRTSLSVPFTISTNCRHLRESVKNPFYTSEISHTNTHSLQTCQSIQMSVNQVSVIHYAYRLTLSAQQSIKLSACHSTVIHHRERGVSSHCFLPTHPDTIPKAASDIWWHPTVQLNNSKHAPPCKALYKQNSSQANIIAIVPKEKFNITQRQQMPHKCQ